MHSTLQTRQQAYATLLHHGLIAIRSFAWDGRVKLCEIEADHLHNIPSLLEESNEARHRYYLEAERTSYLDRLKGLG
jgi:hypothetical protein